MAATPVSSSKVCVVDTTRIMVISLEKIDWITTENLAEFACENIIRAPASARDTPKEMREMMFPIPIFVISDPPRDQEDEIAEFDPRELLDDNQIRAHFDRSYSCQAKTCEQAIGTYEADDSIITTRKESYGIALEYHNACTLSCMEQEAHYAIGFAMVSIHDYLQDVPDSRPVTFQFEPRSKHDHAFQVCPSMEIDTPVVDRAFHFVNIINRDNSRAYGCVATLEKYVVITSYDTCVDVCTFACDVPLTPFGYLRSMVFNQYYATPAQQ